MSKLSISRPHYRPSFFSNFMSRKRGTLYAGVFHSATTHLPSLSNNPSPLIQQQPISPHSATTHSPSLSSNLSRLISPHSATTCLTLFPFTQQQPVSPYLPSLSSNLSHLISPQQPVFPYLPSLSNNPYPLAQQQPISAQHQPTSPYSVATHLPLLRSNPSPLTQ